MNRLRALEVIEGSLLSDAGLVRSHDCGNPYFWVDLSGEEHIDWLYVMKDALLSLGVSVPDKCPKVTPRRSDLRGKLREYTEVALWSSASFKLMPLYQRWYTDKHKVVPVDFRLTPRTLAHWFMGDGASWQMSGRSNLVRAKFCTNGLPLNDIDRLSRLLCDEGVIAPRYESDPALFVNDAASVTRLMRIIEPYIVPSLHYKVKCPVLKSTARGPKDDIRSH